MKLRITNCLKELKLFLVGCTFMIVFGAIDNLGLFVGMDAIEEWIQSMGYSSLVSAGLGNAFSDLVGALIGGLIATWLYRILKIEGAGTTLQQVTGVTIGCLIPVIIVIIFA